MIIDHLIKNYSDNKEQFILLSTGKMAKSLSMYGAYKNLEDMMDAMVIYFLMQDMDLYNDETKAFLYAELERLSIKPNVCKPLKQ